MAQGMAQKVPIGLIRFVRFHGIKPKTPPLVWALLQETPPNSTRGEASHVWPVYTETSVDQN